MLFISHFSICCYTHIRDYFTTLSKMKLTVNCLNLKNEPKMLQNILVKSINIMICVVDIFNTRRIVVILCGAMCNSIYWTTSNVK